MLLIPKFSSLYYGIPCALSAASSRVYLSIHNMQIGQLLIALSHIVYLNNHKSFMIACWAASHGLRRFIIFFCLCSTDDVSNWLPKYAMWRGKRWREGVYWESWSEIVGAQIARPADRLCRAIITVQLQPLGSHWRQRPGKKGRPIAGRQGGGWTGQACRQVGQNKRCDPHKESQVGMGRNRGKSWSRRRSLALVRVDQITK